MNNSQFLDVLRRSFIKYLETGARSNEKLKILHGGISQDLSEKLRTANNTGSHYTVASLGYAAGKEMKKNGDGIGMWRIKQMIELNNGLFSAKFGDKIETHNGCDFAENIFSLSFQIS